MKPKKNLERLTLTNIKREVRDPMISIRTKAYFISAYKFIQILQIVDENETSTN